LNINNGLAKQLIDANLLTQEKTISVLEQAKKEKKPFVHLLVEKNLVKAIYVAMFAAQEFGYPFFDISALDLADDISTIFKPEYLEKYQVIPIAKKNNRVVIGISDPMTIDHLDDLKFHTGYMFDVIIVEHDKLTKMIETLISSQDDGMSDLDDEIGELDFESDTEEDTEEEKEPDKHSDDKLVQFVNNMLVNAIKKGVSDLHFEPYEKGYRVRYRLDGILQQVATPPIQLASRISARLKVLSRLDISEKRVPQDGRMKMRLSKNKSIDFRVNTCPTLFGEKIVMRILDSDSAKLGIDSLGYEPEQKQLYLDALAKPYGMILVTGPTGSGKTVSLYTGLNILNTEDRNISTAEDPAEINLYGINQVNVNPKVGLTFASALKAFLRQDPDVIMVGEIRDLDTGEIAIKAAQTGHLVLSTLHTNDAPQTLTRLLNMGIPPFNIASSVSLIIAQRLGRRLCPNCKQVHEIDDESLLQEGFLNSDIGTFTLYKPNQDGCDACSGGYKGRVGIYQVMPISEEMGKLIMSGGNSIDLGEQSKKEGIDDLRRSGLKKVMQGIIGLEEVNRVTMDG